MSLLSCANCCFNGLQFGSLGFSFGYCVEHRVVLRRADETTCPRHLRKDLGSESRDAAQEQHRKFYSTDLVQFTRTRQRADYGSSAIARSTAIVEEDPVCEAVTNYGVLDSKIGSLAQLRAIPGVRAEVAMLSLARSYLRRCSLRGGPWTSGLHVLWWTKKVVAKTPAVGVADLRFQAAASMERQAELAAWSIVMLRLNLISDIGLIAPVEDSIFSLATLVEDASEATEVPDLALLLHWVEAEAEPRINRALPYERYSQLRDVLHKKQGQDPPEILE